MKNTHFLSHNNQAQENSSTINSLDDLKKFLSSQKVKKDVIEKIAVSFMAKIPAGTPVKIQDNVLHIGESVMKLGEDIYMKTAWTKALVEQTNSRAMQILEHNLPMVQSDRSVIATNDEVYTQAA